jgi:hypothetical protein
MLARLQPEIFMHSSENLTTRSIIYEIKIQGRLNEKWSQWFGEILVKSIIPDDSSNDTLMIIAVPDQATLRGVVNKIWDLNLVLIALNSQDIYAKPISTDEH